MKLSKEQIQQIENYIDACGVKWYDVRVELVDHFATSLEEKLDENPNLDVQQAIVNERKNFSDYGFKNLLNTKTKAVEKKFYKHLFKYMQSFFKFPKIIFSISVFYILALVMKFTSNKEYFFMGLSFVAWAIAIVALVRVSNGQKNKSLQFLILDKTVVFFQLFNFLIIVFTNITSLRSEDSFNFSIYNYIHLGVFVFLMLFYWCAEHVFFMNKKYVKTNYPKIVI